MTESNNDAKKQRTALVVYEVGAGLPGTCTSYDGRQFGRRCNRLGDPSEYGAVSIDGW